MQDFNKLTRIFNIEEDGDGSLSHSINSKINETIEKLAKIENNEGKNEFTEAFKEIYEKYLDDNFKENKIGDDFQRKIEEAKNNGKVLLEKTFDRLIKGEYIESEENLVILEQLFNNAYFLKAFTVFIKKTDKIIEKNKKILTIKNISNLLEEKIKEQKENLEIQKNEIEKQELLDTGKIFIVDGKYYVHNNELIPVIQSILDDFKYDKSLKYGEKNVYFFNDLEKTNDKIILSTSGEDFIIIDNINNKIVYKSKKGEVLEKNNYTQKYSWSNKVEINKSCGINYVLEFNSGIRYFDSYEDEYKVSGGKLINLLVNKLKLEIGKLKLPIFIDIEEFLDTPYFGDSVAIALGDEQYKRKTFSECSKKGDFIDIYIAGGNIFTDKSEIIEEKVNLCFADGDDNFRNGSNLNKITKVIKMKIDKMKNIKNIDLD